MRTGAGRVVFVHSAVVIAGLLMAFPIAWMLLESLKTPADQGAFPLQWIPAHPTLQNFATAWRFAHLETYTRNSLIVAGATTILAVGAGAPAAYGFSRFKYRFGAILESTVLTAQMLPAILLVIPYFVVARALGLLNTYPGLFLVYTALALPFCIWMLIGIFRGIPTDLDEAALVDGCGWFGAFFRIVLPLAAPGIAATALFAFLVAWKEYLFALAITTDSSMFVVTVGIAGLFGEIRVDWGAIMAASVIATLPVLALYSVLDRFLVAGLSGGAVKG